MKVIRLQKDASVRNARELRESIRDSIGGNDVVVIDLGELHRMDLALAQLIISAGREARLKTKTLKLRSVKEGVMRQLSLCGMSK